MGKQNKKPVIFAFIDASNLMYGSTQVGWKVDFAKLKKYLTTRYNISKLFYFAGSDKTNIKQQKFFKVLEKLGYTVCLIPLKTFNDGRKKADVDSLLTVEAIKESLNYQNSLFITGDGDYYWLFEYLQSLGKKLKLLSFHHNTARELKQMFGQDFTDISRIRSEIERNQKKSADAFEGSAAGIMKKSISKIKNFVKSK